MHRFYLPPELTQTPVLTLTEGEAHHATHVLRLRREDRVVVLNGAGEEFLCEIEQIEKRSATLRVVQRQFIPPLPFKLTLVQAVPKGKMMEVIVQKAAELGVHTVAPILSERTVPLVEEQSAAAKVEKWQATAIEAIKQCGSAWLPRIQVPQSPQSFLARGEQFDLSLIATLQPGARHPREYLSAYEQERNRRPGSIAVWVGPEGDFTPAETHTVLGSGVRPITLGQLILRSETAAIYCMSVLSYELQSPE